MSAMILIVHLIACLAIIVLVLVQPSEAGGFLGSSGSMSNMMAPRRKGDGLTRFTTIFAGIFFLTSLSLAIVNGHQGAQKSILDALPKDAKTTAAPVKAVAPVVDDKTSTPPDATDLKSVGTRAKAPKKKPAAPISQ